MNTHPDDESTPEPAPADATATPDADAEGDGATEASDAEVDGPEQDVASSLDAALRSLRDDASRLNELDDDERLELADEIADKAVALDRDILDASRGDATDGRD